MMTSSQQRRTGRKGHTYELIEWKGTKEDYQVVVKLKDITANKTIQRNGTIRISGTFGAIWIDSLEGHQPVYLGLEHRGARGRVIKETVSKNRISYILKEMN
jgi:hypothetical protein